MRFFLGFLFIEAFFFLCGEVLGRFQNIRDSNFSPFKIDIEPGSISSVLALTQRDTINTKDTLINLPAPNFYTNSHMLFGAEIIDPLRPKDFFTRVTRLWKTDLRLGISQTIGNYITSFFSIRAQDSPETNSLKMYEAFAKINHGWGNLYFGQRRVQAGNKSYYLNDAFDRTFWDRGLIFDFLIREIESKFCFTNSELNIFIGSENSSGFIGGAKYFVQPFNGFNVQASALYIARDPEYAAFGGQFGIEIQELFEQFRGYHVIGYKTFDQEPSPIKEITFFSEGRYLPTTKWELCAAVLYKKMTSNLYKEEIRTSFDMRYKTNNFFMFGLQAEYFKVANFYETHLGISAYLQYTNQIRIVPRIRYIITEFGPNIGFLGIEGQIAFGNGD
ncbi:MAG: hypothetical protein IT276_15320 [Ignavibacteriaceae bacterium]|mgnify:FL=1|nr:hypothetical protein [Ignavibacterium sp.]MCC6256286.1 hypothetical protein [Ignavibacteriaceae bacterium]HMN23841.1 hypothetical protein [Ignavibacteriaceae bacterium]HRN26547.1 hypothetical protein [Ignavibacteriaceae bacterium]HRP91830.1 hypothetical protein [Ignavibacteriaceae bacterium]